MQEKQIIFTLNNKKVIANQKETILEVAKNNNIEIPNLCYSDRQGADGNCRSCMVEIDNFRTLMPACCTHPTDNMQVKSNSERALKSQKTVLELLKSDITDDNYVLNSEFDYWLNKFNIKTNNDYVSESIELPKTDASHPAITVNLDACIKCTRCLRACRDVQNNDVIGMAFRGHDSRIIFDFDNQMGDSSCVACGECVDACPTGALIPANNGKMLDMDKTVDSVCPYCGVGCLVKYNIKDNKISHVNGGNGVANQGRLCVKGRYGFDYITHQHRLTKPLIRRKNIEKTADFNFNLKDYKKFFREASWEEALDVAANGFKKIKNTNKDALAGFGSAKGSNEEAYLFQKFIRTGFNTNNVDHCTRLCHASSVTALLECLGSAAVSNPVSDVNKAEVIIIIGANPTVNHPVAATWIKNAINKGTKLILIEPRSTELARYATYHLKLNPSTDVPTLNAIMHTIIAEDLTDKEFINKRTKGFDELKQHLQSYSPEVMSTICGVDADTLKEVARLYAKSKASMIFWGMGISQHIHGTDNARCLIALSLMTGHIGREGTGLHPLRGQNNVQGASDVGLIPMVFPGYKNIADKENVKFFENLWQCSLNDKIGLTVVEIINAIYQEKIKGLYVMGENPIMSDPDSNHTCAAIAKLEHLVVQDIFITETAYFADVILPATAHAEKTGTFTNTDRFVQLGRKAIHPSEGIKEDFWIIKELAKRMALNWDYPNVKDVFNEIRQAIPMMAGITWDRLEKHNSVVYPCLKENDKGEEVIFKETFESKDGLGKFVTADIILPDERPDKEYSFVLITGRILEHWHTGSMSRRSFVLDSLQPEPIVSINPEDLDKLSIDSGDIVTLSTKRGQIDVISNADSTVPVNSIFMAFCYYESAVNKLSNSAFDPIAKIPEFKYCAVKITHNSKTKKLSECGYNL